MFVTLDVSSFRCVKGYSGVTAAVDKPGVLQVEVFGTEECICAIRAVLLSGVVKADLDGRPICMRHFVLLHLNDQRRIAMTVRFEEQGHQR
jgi:hypothetical protein